MFHHFFFFSFSLQNTEICTYCQEKGQTFYLRYFYLSLEEAIYKCGNSRCFFPFDHFKFKNLKNKTVYYYEEVEDGTNDIMLAVSLNGNKNHRSSNPLSSELFTDSQRNPDIESYDFDFSDFLDEIEPVPSTSKAAQNTDNTDFLDFLDEIPESNQNAGDASDLLNANGVDSFISSLLAENTETEQATQIGTVRKEEPGSKLKATKCLEHIRKVKEKKKVNPRKETFLQKVRKTKASANSNSRVNANANAKADANANANAEADANANASTNANIKINPVAVNTKIKAPAPPPCIPSTSKCPTANLRPMDLLNQLKKADFKKSNSQFIQQLVKMKKESPEDTESTSQLDLIEPKKEADTDADRCEQSSMSKTAKKTAIKKEKAKESKKNPKSTQSNNRTNKKSKETKNQTSSESQIKPNLAQSQISTELCEKNTKCDNKSHPSQKPTKRRYSKRVKSTQNVCPVSGEQERPPNLLSEGAGKVDVFDSHTIEAIKTELPNASPEKTEFSFIEADGKLSVSIDLTRILFNEKVKNEDKTIPIDTGSNANERIDCKKTDKRSWKKMKVESQLGQEEKKNETAKSTRKILKPKVKIGNSSKSQNGINFFSNFTKLYS